MTAAAVNIQPLLDLVGHAGELSSEFKAAKTTGRIAMITWIAATLVTVLGLSGQVFPNSHLATILGGIGAALGVIVQAVSGMHFATGRQNLKADAIQGLQALSKAASAGATILTTDPVAPAVAVVAKP